MKRSFYVFITVVSLSQLAVTSYLLFEHLKKSDQVSSNQKPLVIQQELTKKEERALYQEGMALLAKGDYEGAENFFTQKFRETGSLWMFYGQAWIAYQQEEVGLRKQVTSYRMAKFVIDNVSTDQELVASSHLLMGHILTMLSLQNAEKEQLLKDSEHHFRSAKELYASLATQTEDKAELALINTRINKVQLGLVRTMIWQENYLGADKILDSFGAQEGLSNRDKLNYHEYKYWVALAHRDKTKLLIHSKALLDGSIIESRHNQLVAYAEHGFALSINGDLNAAKQMFESAMKLTPDLHGTSIDLEIQVYKLYIIKKESSQAEYSRAFDITKTVEGKGELIRNWVNGMTAETNSN